MIDPPDTNDAVGDGSALGHVLDVHVVVPTAEFDADLAALTGSLGFRIDAIHPADRPATAIVSGHGIRLRLQRMDGGRPADAPLVLHVLTDDLAASDDADGEPDGIALPGGTTIVPRPFTTTYVLPDSQPSLTISRTGERPGVGRAGMRYRDLLPDRWGGRFIVSHITIPDGGPVPDYVHFHKVRFQLIFVKSGWVRLVYEGQGDPFVMRAGDAVLQPPEIRHRVLESSPGLEVIEVGCPADHETIADWTLPLPTGPDAAGGHHANRGDPSREWSGQRFVRHVADGAAHAPWRLDGWEHRDTGITEATGELAGVRVARPTGGPTDANPIALDSEFCLLVVLAGTVTFASGDRPPVVLEGGDSVAIPGGTRHRLVAPSNDCEILDVTVPARPPVIPS